MTVTTKRSRTSKEFRKVEEEEKEEEKNTTKRRNEAEVD